MVFSAYILPIAKTRINAAAAFELKMRYCSVVGRTVRSMALAIPAIGSVIRRSLYAKRKAMTVMRKSVGILIKPKNISKRFMGVIRG